MAKIISKKTNYYIARKLLAEIMRKKKLLDFQEAAVCGAPDREFSWMSFTFSRPRFSNIRRRRFYFPFRPEIGLVRWLQSGSSGSE